MSGQYDRCIRQTTAQLHAGGLYVGSGSGTGRSCLSDLCRTPGSAGGLLGSSGVASDVGGCAVFRLGFLARVPRLAVVLGLTGILPLAQAGVAGAARQAASSLDWPQYLHGPQHGSVSLSTAFTPVNAASASQVWHWQPPAVSGKPGPVLDASPTVAAGRVYIGANSGGFYALNESTGALVWSRQLDTLPKGTCPVRGITSTAAVLPDPVTGTSTVYVSGARFLYALNA